jgi:AraC-like DNA-binding protein
LEAVVACLWEHHPAEDRAQRVVPDGCVDLIWLAERELASRAFEAGYASQAHMNDEVRRLTGATPVRFLEDAALTAA